MMRRSVILACVAPIAAVAWDSPAAAHETKVKGLGIVHPWVSATAAVPAEAVVHLKIKNSGKSDARLTGATTPRAAKVELRDGSAAAPAKEIVIKAGKTAEFSAKGPHLVMTGLSKPLGAYDTFDMTLTFSGRPAIKIEVMVEE
jgi:copper(I)-binding protein